MISNDIDEQQHFGSGVQNPYYDRIIKDETLSTERISRSQNSNPTEIISCTSNIYYEI